MFKGQTQVPHCLQCIQEDNGKDREGIQGIYIYIYMSPLPFGLIRSWILLTIVKVKANRTLCTIRRPDYSLEVYSARFHIIKRFAIVKRITFWFM